MVTQAVDISWPLLLSFLWLFFALICGLAFCNFISLIGQACACICNQKGNRNLIALLCTTLFSLSNTMFLFVVLYLLTKEKILTFDEFTRSLLEYLAIAKVFNGVLAKFFYKEIVEYLARFYEFGYFNAFIVEENVLVLPEEPVKEKSEDADPDIPLRIEFPLYIKKKNENVWERGQDEDL